MLNETLGDIHTERHQLEDALRACQIALAFSPNRAHLLERVESPKAQIVPGS